MCTSTRPTPDSTCSSSCGRRDAAESATRCSRPVTRSRRTRETSCCAQSARCCESRSAWTSSGRCSTAWLGSESVHAGVRSAEQLRPPQAARLGPPTPHPGQLVVGDGLPQPFLEAHYRLVADQVARLVDRGEP